MRSIEAGRALMSGGSPVADPDGPDTLDGSDTTDDTGTTPTTAPAPARAPRYPAVAQAALAGDLSVDAAGLITAGLETLTDRLPSAQLHELERRLVDKAVDLGVHEVRRMVARAVARADVKGHEEKERRQHAERFVAWKEDHTGMVTFTGQT